ncbi:endonuclease/exonuclease/phosphatase family protein [Herbiconiux sp. L3-i23]|uniref:endonuclease/exonuclease/phosphatase family protein n=1 Tax=Herbiconiux sp. L3-i23 TaxID=2905871 RepID=UPI00207126F9|nr:endonuclease/exonuclease/phosphatase family protein [Herbiconiux sp. L3-i23]BDI23457.1 hypothetical protein L3i23_22330 [Herbiconiux sp. L3-i23]
MARLLAAVLVVGAAAMLLILFWPQLFDLQRAPLVAQAVTLRGGLAAGALVAALVLTVLALIAVPARRFLGSLALLLLVFTGANVVVLTSRGFGGAGFDIRGPDDLTVLAWNTLGDAVPAATIADLVIDNRADIVSLPETTEEVANEVAAIARASGVPLTVHTVAYDEVAKARSTSLLISTRLGPYLLTGDGTTGVLPSVVATSTTGGPTIVAVHAVAPLPSEMTTWRSDLASLSALCLAPNTILAGDFNATLDAFDGLGSDVVGADGLVVSRGDLGLCDDAAQQWGAGAVGTWPTGVPAALGTPIDHVLATTNWRVTGFRVIGDLDGAGSDHRPVLAQLSPAG